MDVDDDVNQLYGRMIACCDIERAIESGQFKTLREVLDAVKASAEHLNSELLRHGFFEGGQSVPIEEFELSVAQYESNFIVSKH